MFNQITSKSAIGQIEAGRTANAPPQTGGANNGSPITHVYGVLKPQGSNHAGVTFPRAADSLNLLLNNACKNELDLWLAAQGLVLNADGFNVSVEVTHATQNVVGRLLQQPGTPPALTFMTPDEFNHAFGHLGYGSMYNIVLSYGTGPASLMTTAMSGITTHGSTYPAALDLVVADPLDSTRTFSLTLKLAVQPPHACGNDALQADDHRRLYQAFHCGTRQVAKLLTPIKREHLNKCDLYVVAYDVTPHQYRVILQYDKEDRLVHAALVKDLFSGAMTAVQWRPPQVAATGGIPSVTEIHRQQGSSSSSSSSTSIKLKDSKNTRDTSTTTGDSIVSISDPQIELSAAQKTSDTVATSSATATSMSTNIDLLSAQSPRAGERSRFVTYEDARKSYEDDVDAKFPDVDAKLSDADVKRLNAANASTRKSYKAGISEFVTHLQDLPIDQCTPELFLKKAHAWYTHTAQQEAFSTERLGTNLNGFGAHLFPNKKFSIKKNTVKDALAPLTNVERDQMEALKRLFDQGLANQGVGTSTTFHAYRGIVEPFYREMLKRGIHYDKNWNHATLPAETKKALNDIKKMCFGETYSSVNKPGAAHIVNLLTTGQTSLDERLSGAARERLSYFRGAIINNGKIVNPEFETDATWS